MCIRDRGTPACRSTPANSPDALTVGAVNQRDQDVAWSNYGPCVDIYAPGVAIPSTAIGTSSPVRASGTSMAAPHVSGAAAIYWSTHPRASGREVADAIIAQATEGVVSFPNGQGGSPNRNLNVQWPVPIGETVSQDVLRAEVTVRAKRQRSVLRVQVSPSLDEGQYRFVVKRKRTDGSWRTLKKVYRTKGAPHRRTIDLGKGRYKVRVKRTEQTKGATSRQVALRR